MIKLIAKISLLCISIFYLHAASAQKNVCETLIRTQLDKIQEGLEKNNTNEIDHSIRSIETVCGESEFTSRLRIILLILQKKTTEFAIERYQREGYDKDLIERLESAASDHYNDIYFKKPKKFNYLPLRHPIDLLVQAKSTALLGSEEFHLSKLEEDILYLFSDHVKTYFDRKTYDQRIKLVQRHQRKVLDRDGGIYVAGGVFTPMNAVNPVFGTNPYFGVGGMTSLDENFLFDVFFKVRVNKNDRDFEYIYQNTKELVNSSASYMFGGLLGYKMLDFNTFVSHAKVGYSVERVNTGIYQSTQIVQGIWTREKTRQHRFRSYNIAAGLSAMQHIQGNNFIGVQALYQYSPYSRHRNVITPIDHDYVSLEVFFKF